LCGFCANWLSKGRNFPYLFTLSKYKKPHIYWAFCMSAAALYRKLLGVLSD